MGGGLYATCGSVRGYETLLFHRNIYEHTSFLKTIENNPKTDIVFLLGSDIDLNLRFNSAIIYNKKNDTYKYIKFKSNDLIDIPVTQKQAIRLGFCDNS